MSSFNIIYTTTFSISLSIEIFSFLAKLVASGNNLNVGQTAKVKAIYYVGYSPVLVTFLNRSEKITNNTLEEDIKLVTVLYPLL